jgi:hypothetical protein
MNGMKHVDKRSRTEEAPLQRGLFESTLVNDCIAKCLKISDRRSFHKTGKPRLLGDIGVTPHPDVVKVAGESAPCDLLFYKYGDCCVSKDCLQQAILASHASLFWLASKGLE